MTKLQEIKEKASRICNDNQYLLEEIEVKRIIEEWHSDITILSNTIDNLHKKIKKNLGCSLTFVFFFCKFVS